jgi:hypothetical protein
MPVALCQPGPIPLKSGSPVQWQLSPLPFLVHKEEPPQNSPGMLGLPHRHISPSLGEERALGHLGGKAGMGKQSPVISCFDLPLDTSSASLRTSEQAILPFPLVRELWSRTCCLLLFMTNQNPRESNIMHLNHISRLFLRFGNRSGIPCSIKSPSFYRNPCSQTMK